MTRVCFLVRERGVGLLISLQALEQREMDEIDIPTDFLCPIGQQVMVDPVTTSDGHTYERDKIEEWLLHRGMNTSPVTNVRLANKTLTTVVVVRNQIRAFLDKHPKLVDQDRVYLPKAAVFRFATVVEKKDKRGFEDMVRSDYRVLLREHPESARAGLQTVCEHGTHEMLGFAISFLEQRGKMDLLDEMSNRAHPPHWFPRLLVLELPLAMRAKDQRKMTLIERLGLNRERTGAMLLEAARLNELECVKALLAVGANVNCVGNEGMTPLIKGCCKGLTEVAAELLSMGANVNAADGSGWTPLNWAVECRKLPLIELLLRHGGDLSLRDKSEYTPLSLAGGDSKLQEFVNALVFRLLAENQQRVAKLERAWSMRSCSERKASKLSREANDERLSVWLENR